MTLIKSFADNQLQLLGTVISMSISLDYAVVSVTNSGVRTFLEKYKGATLDAEIITISKARSANAIARTSRGPVYGHLLDTPIIMCLPKSNSYELVYKFTYNGVIKMGDCGTLVVDTETGELYGHIIADSRSQKICVAYVMAAAQIITDIKNVGNWQLLSTFNVDQESPLAPEVIDIGQDADETSSLIGDSIAGIDEDILVLPNDLETPNQEKMLSSAFPTITIPDVEKWIVKRKTAHFKGGLHPNVDLKSLEHRDQVCCRLLQYDLILDILTEHWRSS